MKQGTCLNNTVISSWLGVEELTGASLSFISSPRVWPTKVISCIRQESFSTKELTSNSCLDRATLVGGTCTIESFKTNFSREFSRRILLAGEGATKSDSERRTLPLLETTLRFGAMSSSPSSSSRMMQGTTYSSSCLAPTKGEPVESWVVSVVKENEGEEAYGDRSNSFPTGRGTGFLLVRGRAVELVAEQLTLGACLRVPSWRFFSLWSSRSCRAFASTARTSV